MSLDALTVGETMVAVRCRGRLRLGGTADLTVAGAESTVAIGLARLGHSAAWAGRVGRDESGALITRTLRAEGVRTDAVALDDAPTGLVLFEQLLPDVASVEYHRAGSAGSRWGVADVAAALDLGPRLVHVSGITTALSESCREGVFALLAAARAQGQVVSVDLNHRARLWSRSAASPVLARLARLADVVIASPEELALVTDSPLDLLDVGVREVVVKDGSRGASVTDRAGTVRVPARSVRVVSSVGAGDAFCAGYLSALLEDAPVEGRLDRAVAVGAFAVASDGDWEGLPVRSELDLVGSAEGTALR